MTKEIDFKKDYGIVMWDGETIEAFRKTLLDWYDENKRDLPWRRTDDPYKIWVSEIMLQQTQVNTVIPYYENFLEKFPDVVSLAEAHEDDLLKAWEGLGYYSRVRNMKTAAQQVVADYDRQFPDNYKELLKLQGIGPYTAGAIASIAFNEAIAAVDGNLMRVFSRLFEIDADISKAKTRKMFQKLVTKLIDPDRPGDFNQAIMDIGATISMPKVYLAEEDPIKEFNQSYKNGTWSFFPVKKSKVKQRPVTYFALTIQNEEGKYLIQKRPKTGLLANMWTFPLVEENDLAEKGWKMFPSTKDTKLTLDEKATEVLEEELSEEYGVQAEVHPRPLGTVTHTFSHLKWTIHLLAGDKMKIGDLGNQEVDWVDAADFDNYAFPVPQQKLWKLIAD